MSDSFHSAAPLAGQGSQGESNALHTTAPRAGGSAEAALTAEGVFKGADGLRRLAECQEFWDKQLYGTRLYFEDAADGYLHRGVLFAAVSALAKVPQVAPSGDAGSAPCADGEPLLHELKTDPHLFDAVADGRKTFEIRNNDRWFAVGDRLLLRKTRDTGWAMKNTGAPLVYTGEEVRRVVTHILRGPVFGLADGWVILSIAPDRQAAPVSQANGATTVSPSSEDQRPDEQDPSRAAREGALPDDKDSPQAAQEHSHG